MTALIKKLPFFIFLYAIYGGYEMYEKHLELLTGMKDRIPVIQNKINKTKQKKKDLKRYFQDIEEAKKNIELVAQEVEKVQRQLPSEISDAENLQLIKGIAESLNIKNIFLQPKSEENKGFYFIKNYEMKGTGTFLQFLILFEKIAENKRLLNIRDIELKHLGRKQRGRFQLINTEIVIQAYRFNPGHKEDRGIEGIENQFKEKKKKRPRKKRKKKS
ncbi:MAG: type 4a pilus biogenesis protein PilO [Bacteriovoracaceae bacterium]|nr:type 4a pilus biogenesis protein PilO [Bacteriovoracaceae bacterium]